MTATGAPAIQPCTPISLAITTIDGLLSGMKRMIDIVGSVLALIAFSPILLIIAVAIKATSRGPVFFKQQRVGQHGKLFTFLKFRSMRVDNDSKVHEEYVKKLIAGQAERKPSNGNGEGVLQAYQRQSDYALGCILAANQSRRNAAVPKCSQRRDVTGRTSPGDSV